MARIIKKPGDILKFGLTHEGHHAYAQWLPDKTARFFLAACKSELELPAILALPVAFRVLVFNDTPNRYGWIKVGKAPVPEELQQPQRYARKDIFTGTLGVYWGGVEHPASIDEIRGLEALAVWAHPHIVERLEAQLEGKESRFLRTVSVVA